MVNKNGVNTDSGTGSTVLGLSFQSSTGIFELLASWLMNLVGFVGNHGKSVFYHIVFIISYILCFFYLSGTNNENIRFLILIFLFLLHFIFLFVFVSLVVR